MSNGRILNFHPTSHSSQHIFPGTCRIAGRCLSARETFVTGSNDLSLPNHKIRLTDLGHEPKMEVLRMSHYLRCPMYVLVLLMPIWTSQISLAQSPSAPSKPDPKACSDDDRLRLGNGTALQPGDPANQTLSDKLARTDGVLCPPNIDPDIKAPTPEVGRMPVIPPPGSPGGDPTVRRK